MPTVPFVEVLEPRRMMSVPGTKVLLREEFAGPAVNAKLWHIPTWRGDGDGTYYGRTQIRVTQNAGPPATRKGAARIVLDSYNPTGFSFYGTELISNRSFAVKRGQVLSVKIRAKLDAPIAGGMVGGLFLYKLKPDGVNHDEVDVELLSNQVVAGTNRASTNVYASEPLGAGSPVSVALPRGGKLTGYHTYEIRVAPGRYVQWLVDGRRVRTDKATVPAGPFQLHLNAWAPAADWAEAYSDAIQPAASAGANRRFSMSVDTVLVRAWKAG